MRFDYRESHTLCNQISNFYGIIFWNSGVVRNRWKSIVCVTVLSHRLTGYNSSNEVGQVLKWGVKLKHEWARAATQPATSNDIRMPDHTCPFERSVESRCYGRRGLMEASVRSRNTTNRDAALGGRMFISLEHSLHIWCGSHKRSPQNNLFQ